MTDFLSSKEISQKIKNISEQDAILDYQALENMAKTRDLAKVSERCRIGNNVVDFFTFEERLRTRGKYGINYYEFIERIEEFKKKKFIQNMLIYYDTVKNKNGTKNQYIVWKEVYNICVSAINIFRPIMAMEVYKKYKPTCVLDMCAGWGGRLVGASAADVPLYIGIDINNKLEKPYKDLANFLEARSSKTKTIMIFEDALTLDYGALPKYDMVFTSPPYYFLEKYSNNTEYLSKSDMNTKFYEPLFQKTFDGLQSGGNYILNVNKEIYDAVCVSLFGVAHEIMPMKKSKRQNNYTENIYIWKKP
jgi:hypothetical protein